MKLRIRETAFAILLVLSMTATAGAQSVQGYVVGGAGTDTRDGTVGMGVPYSYGSIGAGLELLIRGRAGAVVDVNEVSLGASSIALNGIAHLRIRPGSRIVPYVMAGYAHTTGDRKGNGLNFSVGLNCWARRRLALRVEAYERLQHSADVFQFPSRTEAYTERYRLVRFGLSFR